MKDGGYNNATNKNKVLPTQNTPALQAKTMMAFFSLSVTLICSVTKKRYFVT